MTTFLIRKIKKKNPVITNSIFWGFWKFKSEDCVTEGWILEKQKRGLLPVPWEVIYTNNAEEMYLMKVSLLSEHNFPSRRIYVQHISWLLGGNRNYDTFLFQFTWTERGGRVGKVLLVYLIFGGFTLALGMNWNLEPLAVFHTVFRIRWEKIISSAWRMEMKANMFSFLIPTYFLLTKSLPILFF